MTTAGEFGGRRTIVTGAAGVHGHWIAEAFAREGADLLLVDFREEPLQKVAESCRQGGAAGVSTHVCDLRDPAALEGLAGVVGERWGAAEVLVNNAGIYPFKGFFDVSLEEWDSVLNLNLRAPFLLTQAIARQMIAQGVHGSIVNITSGAARNAGGGAPHYPCSKAGAEMLTRVSALALAQDGIRVNAVSPGFAAGSEVSPLTEAHVQNQVATTPLGRQAGPHDASEAVLFLCSETSASFITGTTILCDGGRGAGSFRRRP